MEKQNDDDGWGDQKFLKNGGEKVGIFNFCNFCGGEKVGKFDKNVGIFPKIDLATLQPIYK